MRDDVKFPYSRPAERRAVADPSITGAVPERGLGIEIIKWVSRRQNSLRGFVTVRIVGWDLTWHDLACHRVGDREWVNLPGKAVLDRNYAVVLDERTRKPKYTITAQFGRATQDRFSAAVIRAIRERYPDALDDDPGEGPP